MGPHLSVKLKACLSNMLKENRDMFAWTSTDMLGIDYEVICHRLAGTKRQQDSLKEAKKLLKVVFIREI